MVDTGEISERQARELIGLTPEELVRLDALVLKRFEFQEQRSVDKKVAIDAKRTVPSVNLRNARKKGLVAFGYPGMPFGLPPGSGSASPDMATSGARSAKER